MKKLIEKYRRTIINLTDSIKVTKGKNYQVDMHQGVEMACNLVKKRSEEGGKIFFIGNGGSAAIAGHMAIDFWKNAKMPAMAFNDSSLLTCISNDFGYKHVFEKPLRMFASKGDVLFAISSSGKSKNILRGVNAAKAKGCDVVTLSGLNKNNPLRSAGYLNFYVPSLEYGPVEVIHQYICHCILDVIMMNKALQYQKG